VNRFIRQIHTVMEKQDDRGGFCLGPMLRMMAACYTIGVGLRNAAYRGGLARPERLPCRVVSIGNLTVGGTGKTPLSIHVARVLQRAGYGVAVISRGYRGLAERTGGIVSDGVNLLMAPAESGDEPYLIASCLEGVPVLVGRDRFRQGQAAVRQFKTEVIVLDDGFQHRCLARDLDLLLLDDSRPFGNGWLLPRGRLREPVSAMARADAFVLTRSGRPSRSFELLKAVSGNRPIFLSDHRSRIQRFVPAGETVSLASGRSDFDGIDTVRSRPAVAFSGIAANRDFRKALGAMAVEVVDFLEYPDHHAYAEQDLAAIVRAVTKRGGNLLVTTEKDFVRIAPRLGVLPCDLAVFGVDIAFRGETGDFDRFLQDRLEFRNRDHGG